MPYDARAVANAILDYADRQHRPISHLALQKIIYFCHGWYLARHNCPLVTERAEAWGHGPVFKSVYKAFKECRGDNIAIRATKMDFSVGTQVEAREDIAPEDIKFVENIFDAYSRFTAWQLRGISHSKNGAWYQIRQRSREEAVAGMKIPNELIHKHFLNDKWPSGWS